MALEGTYLRIAGTETSEDTLRAQVILRGTAGLTAEPRNRWRGILEEMARPSPRVEMRRDGSDLVVENGDRVELRSASSGAVEEVEGGWDLDQRLINGTLLQHVASDEIDGTALQQPLRQTLRYSLNGTQQILNVETRIEGGGLPAAISFRTTYTRS